jgi:streptogramin lyase
MRAAIAVCLLLAVACTGPVGRSSSSPSPSPSHRSVLASGGVIEYAVPNPIAPGSGCFGCGQASLGGIVAGADGNVWFTNPGQYKVGRVTRSGAITQFDLPAIVGGPSGITGGPDGNTWVTTNALGQGRQDWILRIGPDGAVAQFQAGQGSGNSGTGPQGITAGPDGNLWFTEFWANRIGRMTPAGVLTEFPIPSYETGPRGIVTGPDGNLWFVESHFNHTAVARITTAGEVTEYSLGGSALDQLQPSDIVLGSDGNLWLNQTHPSAPQGEIVRVALDGSLKVFAMPKGTRPAGIASGPDGKIWFTDWNQNTIGRMGPTGTLRQFPLPRPNSEPTGIVAGRDGRLWFTEGSRIGSIGTTVPEAQLNVRVLNFAAGSPTQHEVTVTNTGEAELSVAGVLLVGSDQAAFTVTHDDCTGHQVAVNAACRIDVAFKPGSDSGVRAARLTIADNASASPQSVSLVGLLPNCKLPVFTATGSTAQGEFLSLRDGSVTPDPKGRFVTGVLLSHSEASPVLYGQLPATYDSAADRWVPGGKISPDGSRYAWVEFSSRGSDFHLHVTELDTGRDRTLNLPADNWSLLAFTSAGLYVTKSYPEVGNGPGLWLVNPDSGAVQTIFTDAVVQMVTGHMAWIVTRNPADTLPGPPGIGVSNNEVEGRDLDTSLTATWLYRPGSNLYVQAGASDSIIVSGYDISGSSIWVVSGPGQAIPITVPETSDPVPYSHGVIGDAHSWWIASLDGIYLWTARTGAVLISTLSAGPAGDCA